VIPLNLCQSQTHKLQSISSWQALLQLASHMPMAMSLRTKNLHIQNEPAILSDPTSKACTNVSKPLGYRNSPRQVIQKLIHPRETLAC
jgi:hypothetical protein